MDKLLLCGVIYLLHHRFAAVESDSTNKLTLLIPNVKPQENNYLCTGFQLDSSHAYYLAGFTPNASKNTTHHMLLFGCETPGSTAPYWNCGSSDHSLKDIPSSGTCASKAEIIYAWALDAPPLTLPADVTFNVGGGTKIQYLVLQVHYGKIGQKDDSWVDNSGVFIDYDLKPKTKVVGTLLLGTGGFIPGNSTEFMETAMTLSEDKVIHPFAFRTHTHTLGKVVSGYKVQQSGSGHQWTLIGKRNPQLPQMFYPTEDSSITLTAGDIVAARCTMENSSPNVVMIGATEKDEMCNFYMMYWADSSDGTLEVNTHFSLGPPFYSWATDGLSNIPGDASQIEIGGETKVYEKTSN